MKKLLSSLLLVAVSTQAEVPNVFTPKTPAVANEVNENFAYLEKRINQVGELNDGNVNTTPTSNCLNNAIDAPISYSYKAAALGTSLFLNDEEYKLAKFRYQDRVTKSLYDITMPMQNYGGDITFHTPVIKLGANLICAETDFSGFPIANNKNIGVTYSDSYSYRNTGSSDSQRSIIAKTRIDVVLGQSIFSISYGAIKKSSSVTINLNDYDMSDDYIEFNPDTSDLVEKLDNIIDYIKIEQVTP